MLGTVMLAQRRWTRRRPGWLSLPRHCPKRCRFAKISFGSQRACILPAKGVSKREPTKDEKSRMAPVVDVHGLPRAPWSLQPLHVAAHASRCSGKVEHLPSWICGLSHLPPRPRSAEYQSFWRFNVRRYKLPTHGRPYPRVGPRTSCLFVVSPFTCVGIRGDFKPQARDRMSGT